MRIMRMIMLTKMIIRMIIYNDDDNNEEIG